MKHWLNKHSLFIAAVAGSGLWLGFVCGIGAAEGQSFFNYFIRSSMALPGAQPDGSFMLGNFENGDALKAWKTTAAKIELLQEHAFEGKSSAKIAFFSHVNVSQIGLKDYFTTRNAFFDWSKYKALSFYIFNPGAETKRIILQVSDRKGRHYKEDFFIEANSGKTFVISLEKVFAEINSAQINGLSFFEWNVGNGFSLYFDDIKLTA